MEKENPSQDSQYGGDMDYFTGMVEKMDDPGYFDHWASTLDETTTTTHLPAFIPCLSHFRLLKTCLRKPKQNSQTCLNHLVELENCSSQFFQEIQKKLPEESCEAEKMAYFSMPIENLADLKEAKLHWKALFECSKLEEAKLNIRRTL